MAIALVNGDGDSAYCHVSRISAIIYATVYSAKNAHIILYKAGMALLGVVIGKIFLIDMAGLQGFWRVAAFMEMGLALLLGLAWMYRKAQRASIQAS